MTKISLKSLSTPVYITNDGVLYKNILCQSKRIKKRFSPLCNDLGFGKYSYFNMDENIIHIKKYFADLNLVYYPHNYEIKFLSNYELDKITIKNVVLEDDIWWIISHIFKDLCSNTKFEKGRIFKVFDAHDYADSDKLIIDLEGVSIFKDHNCVKISYETNSIFVVLQIIGIYGRMVGGKNFIIDIPLAVQIKDEIDLLNWLYMHNEVVLTFNEKDYEKIKTKIITNTI